LFAVAVSFRITLRIIIFHKADVESLNSIYPLISFQSNLAFVKNPPSEYMASTGRPGLDILGGLDRMKQKLKSGQYKSQYEFTVELEQLVSAVAPDRGCYFSAAA